MAAFTLSSVHDLSDFIAVAPIPSDSGSPQSLTGGAFGGKISKAIDALLARRLLQATSASQICQLVC